MRVIDDSPDVAEGLCKALRAGGLDAEAVSDQFGVLLDHAVWDGFDAVLVDYILEGVTGAHILLWLREHRPEIRRVLLTGWPDIALEAQGVAHVMLVKPASVPVILKALTGPCF